MSDDDFVEVVIEWGPGGPTPLVANWLRERGLQPTPMSSGLLVTGNRAAFSRAFGVDLDRDTTAGSRAIPIPTAIENDIASVWLPPPRHIQQSGQLNQR